MIGAGAVIFYVIDRGEFYLVLQPVTLLVPVALVLLILFGLACGLWFSPLAARARDVRRLAGYVLGLLVLPDAGDLSDRGDPLQLPVPAPVSIRSRRRSRRSSSVCSDIGEVTVLGVAVFFGALILVSVIGLRLFLASERRGIVRYY